MTDETPRHPPKVGGQDLQERTLALEFERLRFERQKFTADLILRRREQRKPAGKNWKEALANPLLLAVVGGFITIMTTTCSSSTNTSNTIAAETVKASQALQADLLKKFVESPNRETVRTNLSFLAEVGLVPDYAERIRAYLKQNPNSAPSASTNPTPTGLREVRNDDDAIDLVIKFEGGYIESALNPNFGPFKYGITLQQLSEFQGMSATKDDLRALDKTKAREIYRKLFLDEISTINSVFIKAAFIGIAAYNGKNRATIVMKEAISKVSGRDFAQESGITPRLIALSNSLDEDLIVENMTCAWARHIKTMPTPIANNQHVMMRVRAYLPPSPKGLCTDLLPLTATPTKP